MMGTLKIVSFIALSSISVALSPPSCASKPCVNGGTCITWIEESKDRTYICDCPPAYVGETCQYKRCDLTSNHCFNGGTCMYNSTWPQYSYCKCANNWSGDRCEYWILLTDFDSHINMTNAETLHYAEYCGQGTARVKQRYAFITTGESLNLQNGYVGTDGKEFCLSFSYYVDGPRVDFYIAAGDYQTGIPGLPGRDYKILWRYERTSNNYKKWVYFRDTLVGIPWGLFEMRGRIPRDSKGSLSIDQIKVVKGECKE